MCKFPSILLFLLFEQVYRVEIGTSGLPISGDELLFWSSGAVAEQTVPLSVSLRRRILEPLAMQCNSSTQHDIDDVLSVN